MWYIVLIFVIIVLIAEKFVDKYNSQEQIDTEEKVIYNEKYVKKEYLLTQTELKFYKILKSITDELNLVICPQIPLYEIVKNIEYKDFNKIASKSIDFVICEQNLKIKLCIELDDYTHKQEKRIKRDKFVNELLKATDIKIIRIPVQNFYNKENLKEQILKNINN